MRRKVNRVVVHCSDSPHDRGDDAETIHHWHRDKGWDGIGYHWVILENGTIQAGRPEYWRGAHVSGHNHDSIGVCLVGVDQFTGEQVSALEDLLLQLKGRYPGAEFVGHCDLNPNKTCPNFSVKELLGQWW